MTWVTFLKNKSKAFNKFKIFRKMVENESDMKIKCLQSNKGGEFTSNEFVDYCDKMVSKDNIQHPRHLNKMELLREKIE